MTPRDRLIDEHGQPLFGRFDTPVSDINFRDYKLRTPMGKPILPKKRDQHFNQFQFVSVSADPLFIGLAIVRLRFASHAFLYLYDQSAERWKEYRFTRPFRRGLRFGQQPNQDIVSFVKGRNRLTIKASNRPGVRRCGSAWPMAPVFGPVSMRARITFPCRSVPAPASAAGHTRRKATLGYVRGKFSGRAVHITSNLSGHSPVSTGQVATCGMKPAGTGPVFPGA